MSTPVQSAAPLSQLASEVNRRRTFAIISHPDAGKTTLTEKLLLYSGAIDLAGAVRTRRNQRHATSDWMAMEQDRGISITASALEMEYKGYRINLLDTPGHQDFSEDTYRTLMAVDSAVMVLDAAKGIEPQTLKLFQVCKLRKIPILTFINKMDHDGKEPLALLDEIETVLKIAPVPMNWPVGTGPWFRGVYDFEKKQVLRFERTAHGQHRVPVSVSGLSDPTLGEVVGEQQWHDLQEQAELLSVAGASFDDDQFQAGELTPVFFGSALNNFGVEPFLESLLQLAPSPASRAALIDPVSEGFTGFVFKIQANMDMKHRDRVAFLRICSGRFERDMVVRHPRLGKSVRLGRAYRLFARERELIEEAYPGDVIGVINPGTFALGDMVTTGPNVTQTEIPRFPTEHFAVLVNTDIAKYKQFHRGLSQLEEEGAVQVFYSLGGARREPILGVVGELQFDVVTTRLRDEYNVETRLERRPYECARWLKDGLRGGEVPRTTRGMLACVDHHDDPVYLFASHWELEYFQRQNPDLGLSEIGH
jgi:peptide chain release factor 3